MPASVAMRVATGLTVGGDGACGRGLCTALWKRCSWCAPTWKWLAMYVLLPPLNRSWDLASLEFPDQAHMHMHERVTTDCWNLRSQTGFLTVAVIVVMADSRVFHPDVCNKVESCSVKTYWAEYRCILVLELRDAVRSFRALPWLLRRAYLHEQKFAHLRTGRQGRMVYNQKRLSANSHSQLIKHMCVARKAGSLPSSHSLREILGWRHEAVDGHA